LPLGPLAGCFGSRGGRPKASDELRALIWQMCSDSPLWRVPRIHGEFPKLGFAISQSTNGGASCILASPLRTLGRITEDPGQLAVRFRLGFGAICHH
jgi:hypothetical protein